MKLQKINLKRAKESEHPDIKVGERFKYLALLTTGEMAVGSFERQWYGLNFSSFFDGAGLQFDEPGTNSSEWKGLWRIIK